MKSQREIDLDIEKAKKVWKTAEFIATFATLFVFLFIVDLGKLVAFGAVLVAYAITNGVLLLKLSSLGAKFKTIFDWFR